MPQNTLNCNIFFAKNKKPLQPQRQKWFRKGRTNGKVGASDAKSLGYLPHLSTRLSKGRKNRGERIKTIFMAQTSHFDGIRQLQYMPLEEKRELRQRLYASSAKGSAKM